MRATAVALVLIVGAAVVLWFGNMLNSWVLGGLMGGLAALLLSIPISLTLFTFLARRHDERLPAGEEEEVSLARSYDYDEPEEYPRVYEAESYLLSSQQQWAEESNGRRVSTPRHLPAAMYPRLPAAGQSQASTSVDSGYYQHPVVHAPMAKQQPKATSVARRKGTTAQRLTPDRQPYFPGFPGYQGNIPRSTHQSAALRAARKEAVGEQDGVEVLPTTPSRRLPAVRPVEPRASRELPQQMAYQKRRRTVDADPPAGAEQFGSRRQISGPQTGQVNGRHPQTEPIRQQMSSGQMARNVQLDQQYRNSETVTGSLKNPLVRRAPYMYEDDPLRRSLARHIDPPLVRRSSLYEYAEEE